MFTTRPELLGTMGMVASTHWLASAAGMSVLEKGGNAFDAAVTAAFVLQVVEPHLNGPGGDVTIIDYARSHSQVEVVCGQGPAPAAASIPRYRALGLDLIPGTGLLAAVVPGAFDAWMTLLENHGTWSVRQVLEPAIGYAQKGFPLLPGVASTIANSEGLFQEEWPSSAEIYLADGLPVGGALFSNPTLASTYDRLLREAEAAGAARAVQIQGARDAFYRGFVAEAIASFVSSADVTDTAGSRHRGFLTGEDMAGFVAPVERPIQCGYHDYTVFKAGPWSQGPVFLQQLRLLEGFDVTARGFNSADYVHLLVEAAKLAFADREAWYGDPRFVDVPLDQLLSEGYSQERRRSMGEMASQELRPGRPGGRLPRPVAQAAGADSPGTHPADVTTNARTSAPLGGDTCHIDVVDRYGNLVSATPSGGWLQGSPVVPGLGFALGTRAQIFWLEEDLPNSLEPGKRPRTTLTPSIAFREGEPYIAFGTPGGDQQDQWSLAFFLAHAHFDLDLQAAIDAPAFHSLHFPGSFYPRVAAPGRVVAEGRFSDRTLEGLRQRGHEVSVEGDWSLSRVSAVGVDRRRGLLKAAANARGMQGYAVGR